MYGNDNYTSENLKELQRQNTVKQLFKRFLDVKVKQNLQSKPLNQFVLMFNSTNAFHNEKSTAPRSKIQNKKQVALYILLLLYDFN
ncbi:hypothetical protein COL01_10770 [Bacillus thuringiensis]|nr:hypothetical protein COL01_10770 [Bacillus thuringiensis]